MYTDDATVVKNQPDPTHKPAPLGTHHVPDGRPAQLPGVVEIGACEPGKKSPSQVTRDPGEHQDEPLPPETLQGEVPIGSNEVGLLAPSEVTRRPRAQ